MIKNENKAIDKMVAEFGKFTMGPEASLIENVQTMGDTYGNANPNPWAAAAPVFDKKSAIKRNSMKMKLDDLILRFPSSRDAFTNSINYQTFCRGDDYHNHHSVAYMSFEECSYEKFTDDEKLSYMNIGKILGIEPTINTLNYDILKVMKCNYIISEVAPVKQRLLATISNNKFIINDEVRPSDIVQRTILSDVRKSAILVAQSYYANGEAINDSYYKYAHRFDININNIDDESLSNEKLEELLFEIIINLTDIVDFNDKKFYSILAKYIRLTNMMILRDMYSEMWAMVGLILLPNENKHI